MMTLHRSWWHDGGEGRIGTLLNYWKNRQGRSEMPWVWPEGTEAMRRVIGWSWIVVWLGRKIEAVVELVEKLGGPIL